MWIRIGKRLIDTDEFVMFCIEESEKYFYNQVLCGHKKDSSKVILLSNCDYDELIKELDRLESFFVEEFEDHEPCEAVKEAMKDLGLMDE